MHNWPPAGQTRIDPLPPARRQAGLELLFHGLSDDVRREAVEQALGQCQIEPHAAAGLVGAWRDTTLLGAVWLQLQTGRTANLWVPKSAPALESPVLAALARRALDLADQHDVCVTQALLETDAGATAEVLMAAGFEHAGELLYLAGPAAEAPRTCPEGDLQFEPFLPQDEGRLAWIVEQTYAGTLDFPRLNAVRTVPEVLDGYRGGCDEPARHWYLVRHRGDDVGCLLLADRDQRQWELVYMGVVPEARGRGFGFQMVRFAQWLAVRGGAERLMVAVDDRNRPALQAYVAAGFVAWDRRSVLLRVTERR